uniref:Uncharacterized protein n=1 Tax=Kalanchoe fedtschenkoi TaxID=63787 RepID=A0A7N0TZI7_KALFE
MDHSLFVLSNTKECSKSEGTSFDGSRLSLCVKEVLSAGISFFTTKEFGILSKGTS